MSAGLAKLLDKAFVLGYALPALLFLTALVGVLGCPGSLCDASKSAPSNPFADLTYAVLLVYVLGVILMVLNYGLYRLYEGYIPPTKWLWPSKKFHQWRLTSEQKKLDRLGEDPRANALAWRLGTKYPATESAILSTAFGNAIRAFEQYPAEIYGADSISVWPRLLSVVSKDFATLINDAKSVVDFCINISALSVAMFLFCVVVIVLGERGVNGIPAAPHIGGSWVFVAVCALVVAFVSYRFGVSAVPEWGEQVKSAFDCYLPALAKQLGYAMPTDREARRKIWLTLSQQLLYGDDFTPPYAPDSAALTPEANA
jgi:hypothetical protein